MQSANANGAATKPANGRRSPGLELQRALDMAEDFNHEDADLVIQTADTQFRVFSRILTEASPVFKTMLTLPPPPSDGKSSGVQAVEVVESSEVIDHLLRFIYPTTSPRISDLDKLLPVIRAADKYELQCAVQSLRDMLVAPHFLEEHPIRVYAIACMFSWEEEAKIASKHALHVDVLKSDLFDELGHISARSFLRLVQLHQTRGATAMQILNNFSPTCQGTPGSACQPNAPLWYVEWKARAQEELRSQPTTRRIFSSSFLARCAGDVLFKCPQCASSYLSPATQARLLQMKDLIDGLPETI